MAARRIWVTGGRGFAGSHLTRELRERGHEVIPIDRGPEASDDPLPLELDDPSAVHAAMADSRPDAVVHLAAQSSGARSFDAPFATLHNNLDTTLSLLESMRRLPEPDRPRLLSVGSCEEYGAPACDDELPLGEAQPLRPGNPYAVSKAAQTLLCQQYRRAHGLQVLAVRSFTHTGPGQRPAFVWSSFAKQIAELESRGGGTLYVGNLKPSRDLSDVRDVTRAYADLLEAPWDHDVVNLCSGRETRVGEGLEILRTMARCEIRVEVDPSRLRPHDVLRFVGDPSRLREMIGWVPETPVRTTLGDLLEDWRNRVS